MGKLNLGILVVHLLGDNLPLLTHESKDVGEGLEKVKEVLRAGTKAEVPIFLSESDMRRTTKKIYEGVNGLSHYVFPVDLYPFQDQSFKDYIQKRKIQRIILTGFNRVCCVKSAAEEIVNNRLSFAVSDDLLFGNMQSDGWLGSDEDKRETLKFYEKKGTLYSNYRELIEVELK